MIFENRCLCIILPHIEDLYDGEPFGNSCHFEMTVWTIMSHPLVTVWIDLYRCIAKLPAYLMYFFPCIHVYMYFWQVNSLSRSICRQVETSCIAPLISTTDKTPQRAYLQYIWQTSCFIPHPLTILLQYLWCFYNLIICFKNL